MTNEFNECCYEKHVQLASATPLKKMSFIPANADRPLMPVGRVLVIDSEVERREV